MPRMFFPFALFESERIDMGVMAHHEDFSEGHDRFAEMHPIGNDLSARIELFSRLCIECKENEIVDRSGTVLGRERVVIDFVLGSVNVGRALDGLLAGLDHKQHAVRHHGWIGHDHVGRSPLWKQRYLVALGDYLKCHDAAVGCWTTARWEGWGTFRWGSPHGNI